MDPNDFDWKKELSPPPLQGKGFDDKLRRRIEEQLDRKEKRRRKRQWLYPVMGTVAFLAVGAGVWIALPLSGAMGEQAKPEAAVQASGSQAAAYHKSVPPAAEPVKTGVLIGLRQDLTEASGQGALPDVPYSTYRTLMVAPVDGQVRVTAEGEGILVPYGQKFWKIDAFTHHTDTDTIHYLSAHPADKAAEPASFRDDPEERLHHTETLLFAGNQYVSVSEREDQWRGNAPAEYSRVWVKKLPQMMDPPVTDISADQPDGGHVPLKAIYGDGAQSVLADLMKGSKQEERQRNLLDGESWAITRKPGRWTAQAALVRFGPGSRNLGYTLLDYPEELPESVTSHDRADSAWGQARSRQPDAKDVLSSPLDDLTVVWTDKELIVYAPADRGQTGPLLRVALKPGEKLVSAQWATGSYVAQWVEKTRAYLQPQK